MYGHVESDLLYGILSFVGAILTFIGAYECILILRDICSDYGGSDSNCNDGCSDCSGSNKCNCNDDVKSIEVLITIIQVLLWISFGIFALMFVLYLIGDYEKWRWIHIPPSVLVMILLFFSFILIISALYKSNNIKNNDNNIIEIDNIINRMIVVLLVIIGAGITSFIIFLSRTHKHYDPGYYDQKEKEAEILYQREKEIKIREQEINKMNSDYFVPGENII